MTLPAHPTHPSSPTHKHAPKPMPCSCVAIELNPSPPSSTRLEQVLTIRWNIARQALKDLAPKGSSPILHLELRIDPDRTTTWMLIDPKSNARAALDQMREQTPLSITRSTDRITIESPTVCAQIGINSPESPELIYVRTAIFAELNIPGGRYEPIGCTIVSA